MTGWEDIITGAMANTFGTDPAGTVLFGLTSLVILSLLFAVMKPPTDVFLVAMGLIILQIFGLVLMGGAGVHLSVFIFAIMAFGFLIFVAMKKSIIKGF